MAKYSDGVEQALHYLLRLGGATQETRPSARDMAEFYRLSPSTAAKLFTQLQRAGLVASVEGREGGFALARPLSGISLLDVVQAVDGDWPIFRCKEIRSRCSVFDGSPPRWTTSGLCAVHAAMLEAEQAMRDKLAQTTLQEIAERAGRIIPQSFKERGQRWFDERRQHRRTTSASSDRKGS